MVSGLPARGADDRAAGGAKNNPRKFDFKNKKIIKYAQNNIFIFKALFSMMILTNSCRY